MILILRLPYSCLLAQEISNSPDTDKLKADFKGPVKQMLEQQLEELRNALETRCPVACPSAFARRKSVTCALAIPGVTHGW